MFHVQRTSSNVKNISRAGESLNKKASGSRCTVPHFVLPKGLKGHSGFLSFLSWVYSTDILRNILFKTSCKVDTPKSTPTNSEQRLLSFQKISCPSQGETYQRKELTGDYKVVVPFLITVTNHWVTELGVHPVTARKAWQQKCEVPGHVVPQSGSRGGCALLRALLSLLCSVRDPSHGMALLTFRDHLPSTVKPSCEHPGKHTQMCVSGGSLSPVRLRTMANHSIEFPIIL